MVGAGVDWPVGDGLVVGSIVCTGVMLSGIGVAFRIKAKMETIMITMSMDTMMYFAFVPRCRTLIFRDRFFAS